MINIEDILKTEIEKEKDIMSVLNKSNLDAKSKRQVRNRTYDTYDRIQQLTELEEH